MFTGIIKGLGTVVELTRKPGLVCATVTLPAGYGAQLQPGASVAIDGVCLTAARIAGDRVGFDIMDETLRLTTLGALDVGSRVNVERSYRVGDEIGGHIVSGHVTGVAEIVAIATPENNTAVTFRVDPAWMKYILPKGFIALDGCSLTVVNPRRDAGTFEVWFIPETLRLTTFDLKTIGDKVNLEIDRQTQAIVDTVEHYLSQSST